MSTRVKVCGLTNFDDAAVARDAGADYLGFIFYPPSKRAIAVAEARSVIRRLRDSQDRSRPAPVYVGVFVNEQASDLASILEECDLDMAQLAGDEPPELIHSPNSPLFGRVFQAIRPRSLPEAMELVRQYCPHPSVASATGPDLLMDTFHPTLRGGTGHTADWTLAATIVREVPRLMLAGGLNVENVAEAILQVRPFAVDVASGVEAVPGRKDHDKLRAFIRAAKEIDRND